MHPDAQGTASLSPARRVDLAPQGTQAAFWCDDTAAGTPDGHRPSARLTGLGLDSSLTTGWEQVLRAFERPDDRFAAGHRGIDVAAPPGAEVRAIGPGRVAFVGDVARTPTVSIEHDHPPWTSTYQPVEALVVEGDRVEMGTIIGHLAAHGATAPAAAFTSGFDGPRGRPAMP